MRRITVLDTKRRPYPERIGAGGLVKLDRGLMAVLLLGAAFRMVALLGTGHRGDLRALSMWAEEMSAHGLTYYQAGGEANYPAILWVLWPFGAGLDWPFLSAGIRALSIPFDLAIAVLAYRIVHLRLDGRAGTLAASLVLLNPATIIAGASWGQIDALGILPMLLAVVLAQRGHPAAAGVAGVLAALVKPQFAIGLIVALAVVGRRPAALARLTVAGLATAALVLLPLGLNPGRYVALIVASADRYPVASNYAFNPWGAVLGFHAPDGALAILGGAIFVGTSAVIVWALARGRIEPLTALALLALAVYFLPTRVHERYLIAAIVVMAPLAALRPRLRLPFTFLSAGFAFTLAYALSNGPYRAIPEIVLDPVAIAAASIAMTILGAWSAGLVWSETRQARGSDRVVRDRPPVIVKKQWTIRAANEVP